MRLDPDQFVVRLTRGETLSDTAQAVLDPPIVGSVRYFDIALGRKTELHYHDHDEYWLFTEGRTRLILRTTEGVSREYVIEPYTLVATPKGMEHGHIPESDVRGLEWVGPLMSGGEPGHRTRDV